MRGLQKQQVAIVLTEIDKKSVLIAIDKNTGQTARIRAVAERVRRDPRDIARWDMKAMQPIPVTSGKHPGQARLRVLSGWGAREAYLVCSRSRRSGGAGACRTIGHSDHE